MNDERLRDFTPARIAIGRAGVSLPTGALLDLQLAHARARDAVHTKLDTHSLSVDLKPVVGDCLVCHSAAKDRFQYLRRPDLGRRLSADSHGLIAEKHGGFDVVFIVADGLSAVAIERHAPPLLAGILKKLGPVDWNIAPLVIVEQARVAIGDEVGHRLGASLSVVLIGERPGLSSPDSLGIYLTWKPRPGLTDASRNCISNIRAEGLSYETAAHRLLFLMTESRRRKLSGVDLKEAAQLLEA